MELSKRLQSIVNNMEQVDTLADIGTDHGYIPIYTLENSICKNAIAIDINKDPLDKAKLNSVLEGFDKNIDFRLGGGLKPLNMGEANCAIIAGMGGNLIKDILEEALEIAESMDYLILQPAQNPEVLREYLYTNNFEVLKEDLCEDEGIFYEIFKVRVKNGEKTKLDDLYYEISPILLREKHPLMKQYLEHKLEANKRILGFIVDETPLALNRKEQVMDKIKVLEGMISYL